MLQETPQGSSHMSRPNFIDGRTFCIGSATLIVLVSVAFYLFNGPSRTGQPPAIDVRLPPLSDTPYLNASPDVAYVGVAACAECHADEHRSYLESAHSRALADIELS